MTSRRKLAISLFVLAMAFIDPYSVLWAQSTGCSGTRIIPPDFVWPIQPVRDRINVLPKQGFIQIESENQHNTPSNVWARIFRGDKTFLANGAGRYSEGDDVCWWTYASRVEITRPSRVRFNVNLSDPAWLRVGNKEGFADEVYVVVFEKEDKGQTLRLSRSLLRGYFCSGVEMVVIAPPRLRNNSAKRVLAATNANASSQAVANAALAKNRDCIKALPLQEADAFQRTTMEPCVQAGQDPLCILGSSGPFAPLLDVHLYSPSYQGGGR
jgi:hypothetical protein